MSSPPVSAPSDHGGDGDGDGDAHASMSPAAAEAADESHTIDPLVAHTARKIADAINDFKRELDKRDSTWAGATGKLELVLESQTFQLTVVPDEHGKEYPITVHAELKPSDATNGDTRIPHSSAVLPPNFKPTRRASDAELEQDFVPRKKRKLDAGEDSSEGRPRKVDDDEDVMPLITKEDLDHLLVKLREDIQEDTSECVNHVQRLLRRFKDEWHDQSQWEFEHTLARQTKGPAREVMATDGVTPGVSFPSPSAECDDPNSSVQEVVQREAKLISSQVRWVEDCRRLAADVHDKKEEIWRTSSAGFHDRQRQNRESFQERMVHESGMHTHTLNQILHEVRAIGLYAQSMKWETPNSHLTYPPPAFSTPPAFPTQPAPIATNSAGAGRGRGQTRPKYHTGR